MTFSHAYSADSPEVDTLENTDHPGVRATPSRCRRSSRCRCRTTTSTRSSSPPSPGASCRTWFALDIIWVPRASPTSACSCPSTTDMPGFPELRRPDVYRRAGDGACGTATTTACRSTPTPTVMMYNADTLAAAGFDTPPATFDDLTADAAKFTGGDTYLFADNGASRWSLLPWISSGGGDADRRGRDDVDRLRQQPRDRCGRADARRPASSKARSPTSSSATPAAPRRRRVSPRAATPPSSTGRGCCRSSPTSTRTSSCRPRRCPPAPGAACRWSAASRSC